MLGGMLLVAFYQQGYQWVSHLAADYFEYKLVTPITSSEVSSSSEIKIHSKSSAKSFFILLAMMTLSLESSVHGQSNVQKIRPRG